MSNETITVTSPLLPDLEEFNKMPERARSFPSLVKYLGFKDTAIDVEHAERAEGKSSYSLYK